MPSPILLLERHVVERKLFAVRGSDLLRQGHYRFVHPALGVTLLALDPPAIGIAEERGLEYTCSSDWLNVARREEAARRSHSLPRSIFNARDAFTWDEIHWPRFDREALRWFWWEVGTALTYVDSFREGSLQELSYFLTGRPEPLIYYGVSDVVQWLWAALLLDLSRPIVLPRTSACAWLSLRETFGARRPRRYSEGDGLRGRIALVINPHEVYRVKEVLDRQPVDLRREVVLVLRESAGASPRIIQEEVGLPVVFGPLAGISRRARTHFEASLESLPKDGEAGLIVGALRHQFAYLARRRWPRLVGELEGWRRYWQRNRPRAVVTSALDYAENSVVGRAASDAGISTAVIPHGHVIAPMNRAEADLVVYGSNYQKQIFQLEGVTEDRLIWDPSVIVPSEYPSVTFDRSSSSRRSILVLVHPPAFPGMATLQIDPRAQLDALRTIVEFGDEEDVDVRIKLHPGGADLDMYRGNLAVWSRILPLAADLEEEIKDSRAVVAVNYCGSAVLPVIAQGNPLVFYWNDPGFGHLPPFEHGHAHLLKEAAPVVVHEEQLREELGRLLTDDSYWSGESRRVLEFSRRNMGEWEQASFLERLAI